MLTGELVITVPGAPATKGSMKCIGRHVRGSGARLVEDLKSSGPWREKLAGWLTLKYPAGERAAEFQPVGVEVTFTIDRPASHFGTGRNARVLKPSAPAYPVKRSTGDADKHVRNLFDAMQDAGIVVDDAQIVELTARKVYAAADAADALPWPGVLIRVYPVGGA